MLLPGEEEDDVATAPAGEEASETAAEPEGMAGSTCAQPPPQQHALEAPVDAADVVRASHDVAATASDAWQAAPAPAGQTGPAATDEQRRSLTRVLAWLGGTGGGGGGGGGGPSPAAQALPRGPGLRGHGSGWATHADTHPALPASQSPPRRPLRQQGSQRQPLAPAPQAAASPPYRARPAPPAPQRKLMLARPPCRGCGRAEADCCCEAAASPLRLLRLKHAGYSSPARGRLQAAPAACPTARAPGASCQPRRSASLAQHWPGARQAAAPLAGAVAGQQSGPGISIGSIHTAHFGWRASRPAPPPQQPVRITAAGTASVRCPVPSGGAAAGGNAAPGPAPGSPGLDVWKAYLASRRRPREAGKQEQAAGRAATCSHCCALCGTLLCCRCA